MMDLRIGIGIGKNKRNQMLLSIFCFLLFGFITQVSGQQQQQQANQQQQQQQHDKIVDSQDPSNFPFYLQSPIVNGPQMARASMNHQQRANIPMPGRLQRPTLVSGARQMQQLPQALVTSPQIVQQQQQQQPPPILNISTTSNTQNECFYDKPYFARLDECLARKPYPTVGLLAFKNEDLMIKRRFSEKFGCQFILANGLFKNYQISKFDLDSDSQCLDNAKILLDLSFSNVTLNYLWTLRCLNRADQLLEDATHDGKTTLYSSKSSLKTSSSSSSSSNDSVTLINKDHDHNNNDHDNNSTTRDNHYNNNNNNENNNSINSVCVGSSQNFGFASLQLSAIESQVELATDIYKNWRITNIDVDMPSSVPSIVHLSSSRSFDFSSQDGDDLQGDDAKIQQGKQQLAPSEANIKEFIFELLDGDELNWRHLHLFENWTRNKMHSNFLDQYKRFLWISLQSCLRELSSSVSSKNRLVDIFSNNKSI